MPISFSQIPVTLRTPGFYVEFDNSQANQGLVIDQTRILVLGQRLATGTAAALEPVRVLSADQAVILFGRGSQLADMLRAFKSAHEYGDVWAMPLDDNPAGQAAAGTVTVTGTATAAGTLTLYIGGVRVQVGVAAAATAAAVTANPDLVVTAAAVAGVVTVTCRHNGEVFNALDLRTNYYQGEAVPAGLSVAIGAMAGGTANPDLAPALAALGDTQYHHVVCP